jgi:hypothetical protein
MTEQTLPAAAGPVLSEGLGPMVTAREAFERWCADNGHGTLDDLMMPLDRALKNLLWTAWQAGYSAHRGRTGVTDEH